MQILMQQRIVHVGVEVSPVLRQVRNLLQQDPVHHDEVRTHLVKRPNIFWKIRQAKQQACPPLSNTSLDRLLNQLKNLGEIETPVEVFRNLHFSRITFERCSHLLALISQRIFKDWISLKPIAGLMPTHTSNEWKDIVG